MFSVHLPEELVNIETFNEWARSARSKSGPQLFEFLSFRGITQIFGKRFVVPAINLCHLFGTKESSLNAATLR